MQSTSGDYELLYWDVAARSQLQFKSAMRDVTWNTQTCVFGFHVFGMWQQGADGHDILSCSASGSRALLASADTHGKVNLFRFPCSTFQAPGHVYPGHGSHVTSVSFLHGDDWLISTGGMDCSVIQWQVVQPAQKHSTKRTHKDYYKPPTKSRNSSTSMLSVIEEFLPEEPGSRNGGRTAVTDAATQTSRPGSPDKASRNTSPQPPPDPVQEENKLIQQLVDSLFLNN
ncbi:echinoderm microtubule-associated protein-like 1 [Branchiostoma floridae]|uniref:Echinoderm microtubule-associated protein-like 1 n=1 Tax=Branchiostoma floridae TaxID=7739 RepID=A0A9J7KK83_BRAFL|nr:echinoderm microtubule-associated protein-like 1 [Branchiostoma floridae]